MSKSAKLSDQDQVTLHIQKLDPVFRKVIKALMKIILCADKHVSEQNIYGTIPTSIIHWK